MDTFDYARFANTIGGLYQQIAHQMGDYLQENITSIAADPGRLTVFCDEQSRIISYANTFYTLSDRIAFEGADVYYKSVIAATASLNQDIRKIEEVDKWIKFSAAVITLGTAIISANGSGIVSSILAIKNTFTSKPSGDAVAS